MRVLSLFAGIGGFDLAAEWAGWTVAGQVEIDPFCRRVLAKHWPDVPRVADIHDVKGDEFGAIDVLVGGFPCQPFSTAGMQRGADDPRHLWPEMRRVVAAVRPAWVVAENVVGLIRMGLDAVLDDLERLGYACTAAVVPAAALGALHRRERVWVVGRRVPVDSHRNAQLRSAVDGGARTRQLVPADGVRPDGARQSGMGGTPDGLSARLDGPLGYGPGVTDPLEAFGRGWEYGVPLTVAGKVPNRASRLKALGNAIVPQVAYTIFLAIEEAEAGHDGAA